MAISFDSLPTIRSNQNDTEVTIAPGRYAVEIVNADVRKSKEDKTYLNLRYKVNDNGATKYVYDVISESDKSVARYKLQRLIVALHMDKALRNSSFELADLAKLLPTRKMYADLKMEEPKDPKYAPRPIVDCFAGEIFYPIETVSTSGDNAAWLAEKDTDDNDDCPFDLSDNNIDDLDDCI